MRKIIKFFYQIISKINNLLTDKIISSLSKYIQIISKLLADKILIPVSKYIEPTFKLTYEIIDQLIDKTVKIVQLLIRFFLDEKSDEYLPLFIIIRLIYLYLSLGALIYLFLQIRIIIHVPFSITKLILLVIITFVINILILISLSAFVKTGEKPEDTEEVAKLLNKSMVPIITLIILITGNDIINRTHSFWFIDDEDNTNLVGIFFQIMPLVITVLYNIKVFWLNLLKIKENEDNI